MMIVGRANKYSILIFSFDRIDVIFICLCPYFIDYHTETFNLTVGKSVFCHKEYIKSVLQYPPVIKMTLQVCIFVRTFIPPLFSRPILVIDFLFFVEHISFSFQ